MAIKSLLAIAGIRDGSTSHAIQHRYRTCALHRSYGFINGKDRQIQTHVTVEIANGWNSKEIQHLGIIEDTSNRFIAISGQYAQGIKKKTLQAEIWQYRWKHISFPAWKFVKVKLGT